MIGSQKPSTGHSSASLMLHSYPCGHEQFSEQPISTIGHHLFDDGPETV